jgi:hypothetical protein
LIADDRIAVETIKETPATSATTTDVYFISVLGSVELGHRRLMA